MRPALVLATATSGVVVALAYVALFKQPQGPEGPAPVLPTATGRQPAFHLDATPAQRREILESTFPKIASARAEQLGALKDDVALLLDDPEAVRFILTQWHLHKTEGRYAQAAFADLFQLVKNAEFVQPTADILDTAQAEILAKALQAAATQASPALSSRILATYRAMRAEEGGGKSYPKHLAMSAAIACRGDSFAAFLGEVMTDPDGELAIRALDAVADFEVAGLEAQTREVARTHPDRRTRLHANALLMRRGDLAARDAMIAACDPTDQLLAADALQLVSKYRVAAAAPALREARAKAQGELAPMVTLALLRIGDQATQDEMIQAAAESGDPREVEALQLLAASGDVNVIPILLHALDRGGPGRVHAIAAGITSSGEKGFLPVIRKLIEQPVGHPSELEMTPLIGGPELIPRLSELLHAATDPVTQQRLLGWLAVIGGPEARAAMLRERDRIGRLVDEQIRLVDLEARRLGTSAPPLAPR